MVDHTKIHVAVQHTSHLSICYHLWVRDIFDYFFVTARPSQIGNKVPVMSLVLFLDSPEKYSNQKSPRHFTGTGA